jgi:hypothetical protein
LFPTMSSTCFGLCGSYFSLSNIAKTIIACNV